MRPNASTNRFARVAVASAISAACFIDSGPLSAQPAPAFPNPAITLDGKGISINGTDGVTKLNLRFRVQELISATSESEVDYGVKRTSITVRRARLRLEGILRDPRLRVNMQLAFSRIDLDQENSGVANVLRDAYVTWQFSPSFAASVGQAKLPGNRQLLVSSSELQHPDRSPVHSAFTVDRDVGVFGSYSHLIGKARIVARGAVSAGEGRNGPTGDDGLAYTGRFELLPFGAFTNGGDYIEGDLARESSVKLSLAGGVSRNDKAVRTGGQSGTPLYAPRGMTTHFADAMLKRAGVMLSAEYAHRLSPNPVTTQGALSRYVYAGEGVNLQASWLLPHRNWEPQLRFSAVTPAVSIRSQSGAEALAESSFGLARYVNGHRIKMNGEVIHDRYNDLLRLRKRGEWTIRGALEVGI